MSDEWETPQWLFDELNAEFNFDVDLCATNNNNKCRDYGVDYLNDIISVPVGRGHFQCGIAEPKNDGTYAITSCFMNPPYSNPKPFIEKAWEDSKHCKIVCLLKCDPSTKWWAVFWDYENNKPKPGCEVRFLPKRLKYEEDNKTQSTSPFPSVIVIMDRLYE